MGDWDEALRYAEQFAEPPPIPYPRLQALPQIFLNRGDVAQARALLDADAPAAGSGEVQIRILYALDEAAVLRAEGRPQDALAAADRALAEREKLSVRHPFGKLALVEAAEAAFDLDNLERVADALGAWDALPTSDRTPFIEGHLALLSARLAVRQGEDDGVDGLFARAEAIFRDVGLPFYLARALLEHGEWLSQRGGDDAPLDEAEERSLRGSAPAPGSSVLRALGHAARLK